MNVISTASPSSGQHYFGTFSTGWWCWWYSSTGCWWWSKPESSKWSIIEPLVMYDEYYHEWLLLSWSAGPVVSLNHVVVVVMVHYCCWWFNLVDVFGKPLVNIYNIIHYICHLSCQSHVISSVVGNIGYGRSYDTSLVDVGLYLMVLVLVVVVDDEPALSTLNIIIDQVNYNITSGTLSMLLYYRWWWWWSCVYISGVVIDDVDVFMSVVVDVAVRIAAALMSCVTQSIQSICPHGFLLSAWHSVRDMMQASAQLEAALLVDHIHQQHHGL